MPLAFLVVANGNVKLLQMTSSSNTANNVINLVPEVIDRIGSLFDGKKEEQAAEQSVSTKEKDSTQNAE